MIAKLLEKVATSIENAQVLDPIAEFLTGLNLKIWGHGVVRNIISGTPIGHPAHPLLVAVPIGSWTSALVYDLLGDDAAATTSIGIGLVAAVPSAVTGASDWAYTTGAERRVGLVHATLNSLAVSAYASSWFARRRGDRAAGVGLSLLGATILVGSGWLGGHLAYALGVGVDTTAFQQIPEGWHDVAAEEDIVAGTLTRVELDGVSVVVTRRSPARWWHTPTGARTAAGPCMRARSPTAACSAPGMAASSRSTTGRSSGVRPVDRNPSWAYASRPGGSQCRGPSMNVRCGRTRSGTRGSFPLEEDGVPEQLGVEPLEAATAPHPGPGHAYGRRGVRVRAQFLGHARGGVPGGTPG